jgi:hypothetical protein
MVTIAQGKNGLPSWSGGGQKIFPTPVFELQTFQRLDIRNTDYTVPAALSE